MKTKTDKHVAAKPAMLMIVLLVIGSVVSAQTGERPVPGELRDCFERLEMIMQASEEATRYCAISAETAECCAAVKRLELMASLTEQQLKYVAPKDAYDMLPDEQVPDPDREQWLANHPSDERPD